MGQELPQADVVVIGLGAVGGLVVKPFAEAGLRVVALEAGGRYSTRDYPADEIRNDIRNWLGREKVQGEIPTWRATPDEEATSSPRGRVIIPMANGVGGTSIHWTCQAWRFLPWNLRTRGAVIEDFGEGAIPASSTLADWPLPYEDLEPFLDRVEYLVGVSGQAGNVQGEIDEAGNIFEAPRQRPYPLPPLRRSGYTELVTDAARAMGWHPFPGPAAIRSESYEGLPGCTYHGFCTNSGCHVNAKGSMNLHGIPQAEETGNLEIVTHARATEIGVDSEGRASGVRYVRAGREFFQPARLVVVATYTYENVRLLLLSTSDAHPDGLANGAGQVGQHYISHVFCGANGLFPGQRLNRFNGTGAQATCIDDLNGPQIDYSETGFIGGGLICGAQEQKPIATARATPPGVPGWGAEWRRWLMENANSVGSTLAQLESLPYEDSFLDLDPRVRDPDGIPVVRVTFRLHEQEQARYDYFLERQYELLRETGATETWISFPPLPLVPSSHAYGGTRMGDDPDTTVVDQFCLAHEVPNLAVMGASCMPTTSAYNPTLVAQALSWRAADHIVENFESIAG